jgi:hypothetical protein
MRKYIFRDPEMPKKTQKNVWSRSDSIDGKKNGSNSLGIIRYN